MIIIHRAKKNTARHYKDREGKDYTWPYGSHYVMRALSPEAIASHLSVSFKCSKLEV